MLLSTPPGQAQVRPDPALPNLPTLGDTEREDLSPAMERRLGEEIMRDIRGDKDYLDDDAILEYLNDFGNTLVEAWPGARGETNFDFFFFAVRDPELNAFALPGGFIAVHSGLLLAAQSESELASVMAHEIGHVAQRHIARMLGKQREDALIPLASVLAALLATRAGGDVALGVMMAGQGIVLQRQLDFSRNAEREADRVGFQIMGAAGYDTSGMVSFFGRLQAASRNYSDQLPSWLLTHPLTSERIADIQARIREQHYRQRVDRLDFQLVRARVRVLQDETGQGRADATVFFENQLLLTDPQQVAAAQYGLSLIALKQGHLTRAQSLFDAARGLMYKAPTPGAFSAARSPRGPDVMLAMMALEIKLAPGQPPAMAQQALDEAVAAQAQFPLSRGIAHQYAEALIAAGRLDQVIRYLREQVQLYKTEPEVFDLLAKAYDRQGKRALQHMALAESYVLQGGKMAAIAQLDIARTAPDATFYDMSEIDARQRTLKELRREQLKAVR